jgi:phage shock protein PspC (stress-responsive transcriptional regulator)
LGGVAAGLANYTGLDPTIIRILFVIFAVFSSGLGVVIYLILWLAVPPAETTSEKLQMQGKPITLEALKDSVNQVDLTGKASRLNSRLLTAINGIFRVGVKLIGFGLVLGGLALFSAISVLKVYMWLHHDRLFQENIFPVGAREHWLLSLVMGLVAIVAVFLILMGIAAFKRAWPVRGWITGILLGVFLVGSIASVALAADAVPRVRGRYEGTVHTTAIGDIQSFNQVKSIGRIDISYTSSATYGVNIRYIGNPDLSKVKIHTSNNVLYIDSTKLDAQQHCNMLCLFPGYDMTVQLYAPTVEKFDTPPRTDIFYRDVLVAPLAPSIPAGLSTN